MLIITYVKNNEFAKYHLQTSDNRHLVKSNIIFILQKNHDKQKLSLGAKALQSNKDSEKTVALLQRIFILHLSFRVLQYINAHYVRK